MTIRPPSTLPTRDPVKPAPQARDRLIQARGVSAQSPLVDANEAAKLLGVPSTWLLTQARQQHVPHHKLGHYVRFDLDELITWLEQTRVAPRNRPSSR